MSINSFAQHCQEIVQRFLLTAVVVDDELSVPTDPTVHDNLTVPGRGVTKSASPSVDQHSRRYINVDPITWSFARRGMVCGVVSPKEGQNDHKILAKAVARADIVILDWVLNRTSGANALPLLEQILSEDLQYRLRLIAIYTGESDHEKIHKEIMGSLGTRDRAVSPSGGHSMIDSGACRIVVYAKPDSHIPVPESSAIVVEEKDLADRLIADFADLVDGLLPSLVLIALTAVRENVHRILKQFGPDLDPAFLAHRACLTQPSESEQHIVEQIASELQGIMDDAIGGTRPAVIKAIEYWFADRFGDDQVIFDRDKKASQAEVLAMLTLGVEEEPGPLKKGGRDYRILSGGFAGDPQGGGELDLRLASAMIFRQVLAETPRQLSMGTVVRRIGNDGATLLCVTPKCDSVRLTEKSSFLFLPFRIPSLARCRS